MKTIISHKNCPDGIASAMILKYVFQDAGVKFVQYNTNEHLTLPVEEDMIFVDMTPPEKRAQEFVDVGAWCLDHHIHNKEIVALFGDKGIFDNNKCGAEIALEWVSNGNYRKGMDSIPEYRDFARLSGIRDLWKTDSSDWIEACIQAEALRFYPITQLLNQPPCLDNYQFDVGRILYNNKQDHIKNIIDNKLYNVIAINNIKLAYLPVVGDANVSDIANKILNDGISDIVMCYFDLHDGKDIKTTRSLRSNKIDIGRIAKFCGGGGHKNAAGFVRTRKEKDSVIPEDMIYQLENL